MTDAPIDATVRFRDLLNRVRRRWRTASAVLILCVAAGVAMGVLTPKEYTATATLTVSPITLDPFSSSSSTQQINIQTEREVIASSEVARIAADALGGGITPQGLLSSSSVGAPSQSQVLQVSVTASDPDDAAERANAMAAAYLEFRAQGAIEVAEVRIGAIDARIQELEASNGGGGQIAELREERSSLALVGTNPGRIIGVAAAPTSPSSLGLASFLVAGGAAGLLLGAAAALTADLRDRRVRFAERLAEATGSSVYVLRRPDDDEGLRWIMRAIREPFGASRRTRPVVVALFGLPGTAHSDVLLGLTAAAEAARAVVHTIPASEVPEDQLNETWKYPIEKGSGTNLVLIDASDVASPARRANLADGSDVVVLIASAQDELRAVRALLENVSAAKGLTVVPVFAASGSSRRGAEPAAAAGKSAARPMPATALPAADAPAAGPAPIPAREFSAVDR